MHSASSLEIRITKIRSPPEKSLCWFQLALILISATCISVVVRKLEFQFVRAGPTSRPAALQTNRNKAAD